MSKKSTNKSTMQEFSARTMCGSAKVWMIVAMIEALFIFGYMGYRSMIEPLGINKVTTIEQQTTNRKYGQGNEGAIEKKVKPETFRARRTDVPNSNVK